MFLRRLKLRNVRSIAEIDLKFDPPEGGEDARRWTLILGENGTGKSTILRAIALVTAGSAALPKLLGANLDLWVRNGAKHAEIEALLKTAKGEERNISLRIVRGTTLPVFLKDNASALEPLDAALKYPENFFTAGYGVSRRMPTGAAKRELFQSEPGPDARFEAVATLFDPARSLASLESWALTLDYQKGDEGRREIHASLKDLLPNIEFADIDKSRQSLLFKTPDGVVPFSQLSDGYQNVASWCGDLLIRLSQTYYGKRIRDPLKSRGLLLIDELDLHLHPVWKRRLVDFLTMKFPRFQIVATTHSALTVHQADESEVYILRREGAKQKSILRPFEGSPRKMFLHQLLTSPLFGLESTDSFETEIAKRAYREASPSASLKDIGKAAGMSGEKIESLLTEAPNWPLETPSQVEAKKILSRLRADPDAHAVPRATKTIKRKQK